MQKKSVLNSSDILFYDYEMFKISDFYPENSYPIISL